MPRLALFLFWLLLLPPRVPAAPDPAPTTNAAASANGETATGRMPDVTLPTNLDARTQARLADLLTRSRTAQQAIEKHQTAAEAYRQAQASARVEARTLREELERQDTSTPVPVDPEASVAELEAALDDANVDQIANASQLEETRLALAAEVHRPAQARQRLAQARQRLEAILQERAAIPASGDPLVVREAHADLLQHESQALTAEITMLEQELLSQPMRRELLEARRDQYEQQAREAIDLVTQLETQLGAARVATAERIQRDTQETQRLTKGSSPAISELAKMNATLGNTIAQLAQDLDGVVTDAQEASLKAARVQELYRNTRQKLEVAGLSEALGRILLEQRRRLDDTRAIRRRFRETTRTEAETGLNQVLHEEERQALRDSTEYVQRLFQNLALSPPDDPDEELLRLVEVRRTLIQQALALDQDLLRALGDLGASQASLLAAASRYRAYLDEHLLWVRSAPGTRLEMLSGIPAQLRELLAPSAWLGVLLGSGGWQRTGLLMRAAAILVLVLGVLTRRATLRRLYATGRYRRKPSRDSFVFTLQALLYTVILAAPLPAALYLWGRSLGTSLSADPFALAVSQVLCITAEQFFILALLRTLCLSDGLAEVHFLWPKDSTVRLRRRLFRLMAVFLPSTFVTLLVMALDPGTLGGGLSWLGFLLLATSLAAFSRSLFQSRTGILSPHMEAVPGGLVARFRPVWQLVAVAMPLGLAVLASFGYRYTAIVLLDRTVGSMYLAVGILLLHQFISRWLVLSRRKLAIQAALARRREASADEMPLPSGEERTHDTPGQPEIDLVALGAQTQQLLFYSILFVAVIGMWSIWSDVLPAFGFLDQVTLWTRSGTIDGEPAALPVTLADLLTVLLIVVTTVLVTRRLPALLEILLLQRMGLTPGARYAARTLSSYSIMLVGIALAFLMIGLSWSQLQWLVAALSVGIGFGLQEIVANFISGLIILFERPIRVGDVITVGDTDGVVSRIRIRATTIRNWERKELLIPNKEIITSRLLNWSLSDQTTRIFITVGLVYGGDVPRAMALMAAAAEAHPRILSEPSPFVCFEGFGDNALILNLRCYTNSIALRLHTRSELHEEINTRFREAGLVIAFPQRDVHLGTSTPLDVRIQRDAPKPADPGIKGAESKDRN